MIALFALCHFVDIAVLALSRCIRVVYYTSLFLAGVWAAQEQRSFFSLVAQGPVYSWNLWNVCWINKWDNLNLVQHWKPPGMHSCLPQAPSLLMKTTFLNQEPWTQTPKPRYTDRCEEGGLSLGSLFYITTNDSVLFLALPFHLCLNTRSHPCGRLDVHGGPWGCAFFPPGA